MSFKIISVQFHTSYTKKLLLNPLLALFWKFFVDQTLFTWKTFWESGKIVILAETPWKTHCNSKLVGSSEVICNTKLLRLKRFQITFVTLQDYNITLQTSKNVIMK